MTQQNVATTTLKYEVDESSIRKTLAANESLRKEIEGLGKDTRSLTGLSTRLNKGFEGIASSAKESQQSIDDLRKSIRETATEAKKPIKVAKLNTVDLIGQGSTVGGALGSVAGSGALGGSLAGTGDLLGAVESVAKLRQEFSTLSEGLKGTSGLTGVLANTAGSATALTAAALPAALAVGGIVLAIDGFNKSIAAGQEELKSAIGGLNTYFEAIKDGTTESITAQIGATRFQKELIDQQLATLNNARSNAFSAEQGQVGGDFRARLLVGIGDLTGAFAPLNDEIKRLQTESLELSGSLSGYTRAVESGLVASNDFVAGLQDRVTEEKAYIQLLRDGTIEQSKRRASDLQTDQGLREGAISELRDQIGKTLGEAGYDTAIIFGVLNGTLTEVPTVVQPLVDELNRLKTESEGAQREIENINKALPQLTFRDFTNNIKTGLEGAEDAAKQFLGELSKAADQANKDAAEKSLRGFFKTIGEGVETVVEATGQAAKLRDKTAQEITRIEEQSAVQRTQIAERYTDALIDATKQATEAAANSLRKLEQSNRDALRQEARDSAKADREFANAEIQSKIESQRAERDALTSHLRTLEDIRNKYQQEEYDATLSRDFAALFSIRQRKIADLNSANTDFSRGGEDRATAERDRIQDAERTRQVERTERTIALSQKIEDLRIGYQQELIEADRARLVARARAQEQYNRDLNELQLKTQRETELKRRAAQQELGIVSQGTAQRLKLEAQAQQTLIRGAFNFASNVATLFGTFGVKKTGNRAIGGGYGTLGAVTVNEDYSSQRESFTTQNGRSAMFPPGAMGLWIPAEPGRVNANRGAGGVVLNQTVNVQGSSDPNLTAQAVVRISKQAAWEVLEELAG